MPPGAGQLALDTNVLMELGGESDRAHEFREVFLERGYRLRVPPTVLVELYWLQEQGDPEKQAKANRAIREMEGWSVEPYRLTQPQEGVARRFSRLLRSRRLLPMDESHDGRILAE